MALGMKINSFSLYFLIITCGILVFHISAASFGDNEDLPLSKLSKNAGTPTLRFLYCYSCGYRKVFEQYEKLLREKYPFITVDGANYDPPGLYMLLVRIIGVLKFLAIICVLSGVNVFGYLNLPQPAWWTWCTDNKIYACMMMFFLCNLIEGQLVASGAFEIYLNDVPIWSKLESGQLPQPPELFQIIDNHMQFTDTKIDLNGFAK